MHPTSNCPITAIHFLPRARPHVRVISRRSKRLESAPRSLLISDVSRVFLSFQSKFLVRPSVESAESSDERSFLRINRSSRARFNAMVHDNLVVGIATCQAGVQTRCSKQRSPPFHETGAFRFHVHVTFCRFGKFVFSARISVCIKW